MMNLPRLNLNVRGVARVEVPKREMRFFNLLQTKRNIHSISFGCLFKLNTPTLLRRSEVGC